MAAADDTTSSTSGPKRFQGPELSDLRDEYWDRMEKTRKAATDTREFLAGRKGIALPESVTMSGADAWISDIPHKRTVPQKVRQKCIAKQLDIKRPQTAAGPRASSVATRIEAPLGAIMRDKTAGFPWADVNDLLLFEGLAFSTVALAPERWGQASPIYDGKGDVQRRYRFDSSGNHEDDEGYSGLDLGAANKAHQGEYHDYLARRVPIKQRAYSIRQCAPIWGDGLELEGLIVETWWTQSKLLRSGISVTTDAAGLQTYPLGARTEGDGSTGGGGKDIRVIEAWLLDDEGKPYVSLSVDGKSTWRTRDGKREPHITDLSVLKGESGKPVPCYGRLPIAWGWGLGWSAADLDDRAMGFLDPFMQGWRNVDSLLTHLIAWSHWRAFPALLEKIPIGMPDDEALDGEEDKSPDIQPMKITRVRGDIVEIGTQGPSSAVFQAVDIIMSGNKEQGVSEADSSQSGFSQSIAEGFGDDSLTTVHDSARGMYQQNASFVLEGAKAWGEAYEPIRVYDIADVLLEQTNPSDVNQILTLEPDLIGDSFDVRAVTKKTPGENPAVRQQNAELVERRLMTTRKFLEEDGDSAPEATVNEIEYEDILKSDAGKAFRLKVLESYTNDEFIKQIRASIAQGQANPQNGLPVGLAQGLAGPPPDVASMGPPGQPAGGDMTGLSAPAGAGAGLGGVVAGGLSTGPINNAMQAGGVLPAGGLPGAA